MSKGSLVTAKNDHPANVVFRVDDRTRNGWLTCSVICQQDGSLLTTSSYAFRLRCSDMRVWRPSLDAVVRAITQTMKGAA